ncbi:MAG: hypothetical protein DME22_16175 [Verrucomicrobia bacterium]|nr:MAG: hypothetical protein DME22_16175 [Verrucomicrobiota bacterium]PYK00026.1 MAG: hypothetical protein DME23_08425 [Verrucomicrobiota bacterium]
MKSVFMAARIRQKVDRAPPKSPKGLDRTVCEVERLPEQRPGPGALLMESKGQQLNKGTKIETLLNG